MSSGAWGQAAVVAAEDAAVSQRSPGTTSPDS